MNWEKLSVIGAVTSTGKFFQQTVSGACRGPQITDFLQHLLKQISGKIFVVLDNAGIHKCKPVQALVNQHSRLKLVFLPPYAPELNPIEKLWALVKHHILGNRVSVSLDELKKRLRAAWTRVRRLSLEAYSRSGIWRNQP